MVNAKSLKESWKIAQIVSFDDSNGWHRIKYASGLNEDTENSTQLILKNPEDMKVLKFDKIESTLVLAAREFYVISRSNVQVNKGNSSFNLGPMSSSSILVEANRLDERGLKSVIGKRVESNCVTSSEWFPCTILAVDKCSSAEDDGTLAYSIVSDEGQVFPNISADLIRGLDFDYVNVKSSGNSEREPDERIPEGVRAQISRTYPILAVNRRGEERQRNNSTSSDRVVKRAVLKRTWSALSLTASMCPIAVGLESKSKPYERILKADVEIFSCSIGDRVLELGIDASSLAFMPIIRVGFYSRQGTSPIHLSSQNDMTLVSLLWKNYERDGQQQVCWDHTHELFFSFSYKDQESSSNHTSHLKSSRFQGEAELYPQNDKCLNIQWGQKESISSPDAVIKHSSLYGGDSRKQMHMTSYSSEDEEGKVQLLCDGFDEISLQSMEIISFLADASKTSTEMSSVPWATNQIFFENKGLSKKLIEQLEDPLLVVGGVLPEWCFVAPSFSPHVFSYKARRLLLERATFGVSRSTLRQQESKVNVGRLRQRMASLRARAVELVGEAFSGGAEDPTALQLQADELYGMEEALAARMKAAFKAEKWQEHSLQVAKAAINRGLLIPDATSVMEEYANDDRICRRRLEVRFDGESGFDAASGDEAGVTRGFYADVAEALLSCDVVAGVSCMKFCSGVPEVPTITPMDSKVPFKLPLWIPDVDTSGQVIIPTPRADQASEIGVFPRPLSPFHPHLCSVLKQFRFMGRLFASAMRDSFMFPLPLSSSFLKLVQHGSDKGAVSSIGYACSKPSTSQSASIFGQLNLNDTYRSDGNENLLCSADLPRPGFLGGEVYAVETYVCAALDRIDKHDPPLNKREIEKRYQEIASDKGFARAALGKSYDLSFQEYFEDRTFVDPLDPSQGPEATPLYKNGYSQNVTINNIRSWVSLSKIFILHDGIIAQALAFRQGVEDFFSADHLRLFMPEELQRDVCGVGDNVDNWNESDIRALFKLDGGKGAAEALVAVAAIGGEGGAALSRRFGPTSPTISFVVKALREATPKMRRQFLSFVTSVPIVTPGLIEVVPVVSPSGDFLPMRDPGCLPRANTCSRRLYLPKFENYEVFSHVLWTVVKQEAKFKGFYEWRGS
jgi:hypothetical protein